MLTTVRIPTTGDTLATAGMLETLETLAAEETSTAVGMAATADISHSKGSRDVNRSKKTAAAARPTTASNRTEASGDADKSRTH
jgi:hypothetical protein